MQDTAEEKEVSEENREKMREWLSWLERRPVTAEVEGSSPFWVVQVRRYLKSGILAQLGEHLPYKQRVIGSSPIGPILFEESER